MANLTSVTLTAGVPTAGTGTVGTIDNVTGTAGSPSVPVLTVQGVASGTAQPVSGTVAATQSGTWNVTNVSGTVSLPTGASTSALQPTNATQGSTTSGQTGTLVQGAVTTGSPTYTTAQTSPLSLDTSGNLRVNVVAGGGAGGTSSTVGSTAPSVATAVGFTDGTNMQLGVIKPASTAPIATDRAIVVAVSPNSSGIITTGTAGSASSQVLTVQGIASMTPLSTTNVVTAAGNGYTKSRVNAAASTNATSLKASAGNISSIDVFNVAAYSVFLKLYNKASAPTVGTDTPVWTIPVAAGGGFSREFNAGDSFSTGIAYAITKLQADADTTVVVAGDLTGQIRWI